MWLIDQIAEKHISDAQKRGEFDNLPGQGKPLQLDDDSAIPAELRTGYRLLKNAGFIPPELIQRKEALQLVDLLQNLDPDCPAYQDAFHQYRLLELRLQLAGVSTQFLHSQYQQCLQNKLNPKKSD